MSRYIDADELIKALNDKEVDYRADIDEVIRATPTADVEPVRHGKWLIQEIDNFKMFTCSECGGILFKSTFLKNKNIYCNCCGAKMDKE